ncbi:hypothetical protein PCI56_00635 [Plesiomonas shigelloides subsp. oncorhynchi]|nr:hypothetical protein [Plesiomonas shigelloides]
MEFDSGQPVQLEGEEVDPTPILSAKEWHRESSMPVTPAYSQ